MGSPGECRYDWTNMGVAEKQSPYFSQFGEDRILAEIFAETQRGFCVEIGANDGVNDSTTLYFERTGWKCLLIEPNPELCKQIRAARVSPLVECAASDHEHEVTLFVAEGAPRAHGVSTINGDPAALHRISSFGFRWREVRVVARRLDDILLEHAPERPIDFISIDVEGHELSVLEGFSLDTWKPRILLIEDNANFRDPAVRNFLRQRDYVPFRRSGVNDWYARRDDRQLVDWRSRSAYACQVLMLHLAGLAARTKAAIGLIPGVRSASRAWKSRRIRSGGN